MDRYFSKIEPSNRNVYETGLYVKTDNNNIAFDKDDKQAREFVMYEKDEILSKANSIKSKIFSNTVYAKDRNKKLEQEGKKEAQKDSKSKNQILDN